MKIDNIKNLEIYNKGKSTADNIVHALVNESDCQKQEDLLDILLQHDRSEEIIEKLTDTQRAMQIKTIANQGDMNQDIHRLKLALTRKIRLKRAKRLSIASSVAAVMLLASFLIMNLNEKRDSLNKVTAEQRDFELAIGKPYLIIDSGDMIDLQDDEYGLDKNNIACDESNTIYYTEKESNSDFKKKQEYHTLIIPHQTTYTVVLTDGSEVVINAGGKLRYPRYFDNEKREVFLEEGEAYFKVKKSTVPFVVRAENSFVEVYGTEFNVKNENNGAVTTILVSGSVGVGVDDGPAATIKPNQMAQLDLSNNSYNITEVDPSSLLTWMSGRFEFDGVSFDTMISEISSWYGITISYDKEQFKDVKVFMGTSERGPLSELLPFIQKIIEFNIHKIEDGKYRIEKK